MKDTSLRAKFSTLHQSLHSLNTFNQYKLSNATASFTKQSKQLHLFYLPHPASCFSLIIQLILGEKKTEGKRQIYQKKEWGSNLKTGSLGNRHTQAMSFRH